MKTADIVKGPNFRQEIAQFLLGQFSTPAAQNWLQQHGPALMQRAESIESSWNEAQDILQRMHHGQLKDFSEHKPVSELTLLAVCAGMDEGAELKAKLSSSESGRRAANVRHSAPGGAREKQQSIRNSWASGKYSSRDLCAEEECRALGMSLSAARKALRNTPEPIKVSRRA